MGFFVDRDGDGKIVGRFGIAQRDGQEYLANDAPEIVAIELGLAKEAKRIAAMSVLADRVAAGMAYAGTTFDIDDMSRSNIAAIASIAAFTVQGAPGFAWPENGKEWVTHDNQRHFFATPTDFVAFSLAAGAYYEQLFFACRIAKDAIAAAPDQAALDTVDVSDGYPG